MPVKLTTAEWWGTQWAKVYANITMPSAPRAPISHQDLQAYVHLCTHRNHAHRDISSDFNAFCANETIKREASELDDFFRTTKIEKEGKLCRIPYVRVRLPSKNLSLRLLKLCHELPPQRGSRYRIESARLLDMFVVESLPRQLEIHYLIAPPKMSQEPIATPGSAATGSSSSRRPLLWLVRSGLEVGNTYPSLLPGALGDETYFSTGFSEGDAYEAAIADLYGLRAVAANGTATPYHAVLSAHAYPEPGRNFQPMLRDFSQDKLRAAIADWRRAQPPPTAAAHRPTETYQADTTFTFPVGPIHAGVANAIQFNITAEHEAITAVDLRYDAMYRGIEKLFLTSRIRFPADWNDIEQEERGRTVPRKRLVQGWQLAEGVTSDALYAHSLAYCLAVESLYKVQIPESLSLLRGIFLEFERIVNHVTACARIAQDVAQVFLASNLFTFREYLLRLQAALTGHRFLAGLNQVMACKENIAWLESARLWDALDEKVWEVSDQNFRTLRNMLKAASAQIALMVRLPAMRSRLVKTGAIAEPTAARQGVTGFVARAAGLEQDARIDFPWGPYASSAISLDLLETLKLDSQMRRQGDLLSHLELRQFELHTSYTIIQHCLNKLSTLLKVSQGSWKVVAATIPFRATTAALAYGFGIVESFRGPVSYTLVLDQQRELIACHIADPSIHNITGFCTAARNVAIGDFPLLNHSWGLSGAAIAK